MSATGTSSLDAGAGPLFEQGEVLARRYRLERPLPAPGDGEARLWRAVDEVLARPVAVRVLPARHPAAVQLLEAGARAGGVTARPLTRVYDAAVEPRRRRPSVAYLISEWVDGRALPDLLAAGPLPPGQVLALGLQLAEALVALHAAGLAHARLHPGNVFVDAAGHLRITDTAAAAGVRGLPAGRPEQAGDVRDAGALLYALAAASWPATVTAQPARGLPAAPGGEPGAGPGRLRGVPRALDAVVQRTLAGGPALTTARGLQEALERAAAEVGRAEREAAEATPRLSPRLVRAAPYAASAALLAVIATVCYSVGRSVGEVAPPDDGLATTTAAPAAPGSTAPAAGPVNLRRALVRDFDPHGEPPQENSGEVVNAYDGESSTAWTTDLYRSEQFGGLKDGVGLLVDLSRPTALAEVDVDLTRPGVGLDLRAGNQLGADERSLPVVGRLDQSGGVARLAVPAGIKARYWLVWLTRLPNDSGHYRAGIDELRLLRR